MEIPPTPEFFGHVFPLFFRRFSLGGNFLRFFFFFFLSKLLFCAKRGGGAFLFSRLCVLFFSFSGFFFFFWAAGGKKNPSFFFPLFFFFWRFFFFPFSLFLFFGLPKKKKTKRGLFFPFPFVFCVFFLPQGGGFLRGGLSFFLFFFPRGLFKKRGRAPSFFLCLGGFFFPFSFKAFSFWGQKKYVSFLQGGGPFFFLRKAFLFSPGFWRFFFSLSAFFFLRGGAFFPFLAFFFLSFSFLLFFFWGFSFFLKGPKILRIPQFESRFFFQGFFLLPTNFFFFQGGGLRAKGGGIKTFFFWLGFRLLVNFPRFVWGGGACFQIRVGHPKKKKTGGGFFSGGKLVFFGLSKKNGGGGGGKTRNFLRKWGKPFFSAVRKTRGLFTISFWVWGGQIWGQKKNLFCFFFRDPPSRGPPPTISQKVFGGQTGFPQTRGPGGEPLIFICFKKKKNF